MYTDKEISKVLDTLKYFAMKVTSEKEARTIMDASQIVIKEYTNLRYIEENSK